VITCGDLGGRTASGRPCKKPSPDGESLCAAHREGAVSTANGRPRARGNLENEDGTFSEGDRARVERLAAVLTLEQLADYFGLSERTMFRRLDEDPLLMAAYKAGKATAIMTVATSLYSDATSGVCEHCGRGGNLTAKIFYLKTQAGWREVNRHEHTGADGGPIETREVPLDVDAMDEEELRTLDRILFERSENGRK
jgi:hypothetical protein